MMSHSSHQNYYAQAELYDIAFSFKEYAVECEFILSQFQTITGRKATSWLELAAGPARHTLEMAQRGLRAQALDLSEAMVDYGKKIAKESGVTIEYKQGDMIDFKQQNKVDVAALMIDSICYILDDDSLIRHFQNVADILADDGLYIIEMAHPKDIFAKEQTTRTDWEIKRDGKTVHTSWGEESDVFDPVTQITDVTVRISVECDGERREFVDRAKQRKYTCTEFHALVKASGCFEIVGEYGAMDLAIDLRHEKAWRMISILQKRP